MTFPMQFHVGPAVINAHLILEVLAYVLGFQYLMYLRRKNKDTITSEQRMWIILAGAAGALFGSRCVGYFSDPGVAQSMMDVWLGWMKSKSILGGLLGGIIGVEIGKQCMGIKTYTGDLFVYPILLAMIIGRLGCFSQGVFDGTHGNPTSLPWAMNMGDGILRHPTQLYEVIFLILLWLVLKRLDPRLVNGARFKIFATAYFLYRFLIEFIKPVYVTYLGLTAIQVACLVGLIYCLRVLTKPSHLFKECGRG